MHTVLCGAQPSVNRSAIPALAGLWRASELGHQAQATRSTGHAALDAVLPGGGWPLGSLTELLQGPAHAEWQLLAPALAALQAGPRPACVVLVGAPHTPLGPALAARGLDPQQLLWVAADSPAARLWATVQALRCREVAAVLAWLPQALPTGLRRLQLAAQQQGQLLWVLRPPEAAAQASPAPLRLALHRPAGPPLGLQVTVLKRRGPPLPAPVDLPASPPRLQALLAASRALGRRRREAARPQPPVLPVFQREGRHALDRLAARAG